MCIRDSCHCTALSSVRGLCRSTNGSRPTSVGSSDSSHYEPRRGNQRRRSGPAGTEAKSKFACVSETAGHRGRTDRERHCDHQPNRAVPIGSRTDRVTDGIRNHTQMGTSAAGDLVSEPIASPRPSGTSAVRNRRTRVGDRNPSTDCPLDATSASRTSAHLRPNAGTAQTHERATTDPRDAWGLSLIHI